MAESDSWHRVCQVCGSDQATSLYNNRMAPLDELDMSYQVARCQQCGFLYAAQLPPPSRYQQYYQSLSKYDVVLPASAVPAVDKYRAQQAVAFVKPLLAPDASVADLGCGYGTLLNAFAEAGYHKLSGLDPAPNAQLQAQTLFGLEHVYSGTLSEAAQLPGLNAADLVCLMGVLEHLPLLQDDMQSLTALLADKTLLLLEVPASERFLGDDFEPFGEFSLEHIQFFSMASLNRLMAELGWDVVKSSILPLPPGTTDSLLCVYQRGTQMQTLIEPADDDLQDYIQHSSQRLEAALSAVSCATGPIIIFGAGSHTARLLPYLEEQGSLSRVIAIVDNNTNLQGKTLADWQIAAPDQLLPLYPDAAVLISSYRSQQVIKHALQQQYRNPILTIYPEHDL